MQMNKQQKAIIDVIRPLTRALGLRIVMSSEVALGGYQYNDKTILWNPKYNTDLRCLASTLCHEIGHHMMLLAKRPIDITKWSSIIKSELTVDEFGEHLYKIFYPTMGRYLRAYRSEKDKDFLADYYNVKRKKKKLKQKRLKTESIN